MNPIVFFALGGIASYAARVSMVVAGNRVPLDRITERLRFVAPAAVGAIVASVLFVDGGSVAIASPAEIIAVGAAVAAARWSNQAWMALIAGLPIFWMLSGAGL